MAIDVVERADDLVIDVTDEKARKVLIDENASGKKAWPGWKTWLVWLIPFAAFVTGATLWAVDHVEDDLEDATIAEIDSEYGIELGRENVDFDYRDGEVAFTRPSGVSTADVESTLEARIDGLGSGRSIGEGDIRSIGVLGDEASPPTTAPPPTTAAPTTTATTAVPVPETGSLDVAVDTNGTTITLDGTVLSDEQRAAIVDAATQAVGAENVIDNLTVSGLAEAVPGADAKVADMAALFAGFSGLESGSGTLSDTALSFDGVVADAAAGSLLQGLAGDSNDETTVNVTVAELSLDEEVLLLQAEIDALQDEILENVVFQPASDVLVDRAAPTLDKVAAAMARYTRPVVLVGGHTDSDGPDAYNLELSDRRTRTVSDYLVDQGIAVERLQGQGFGETEPVAPNDTDANKQRNRRVAFTARGAFADG